ncbi:MAG: class I SAM-dependent methyltransferase, partial [Phycisphaerae bacterium]
SARAEARGSLSLWCEADALRLPFRSGSFTITSCAFSVRNFEDLDAGLAEMFRVLRPGGRAVILEFTRPRNRIARAVYEFYSHRLMPLAATLIAGDTSGAYRYLPRSVVSFLSAEQMCARLRRVGFSRTTAMPLTLGIVTVYIATRD